MLCTSPEQVPLLSQVGIEPDAPLGNFLVHMGKLRPQEGQVTWQQSSHEERDLLWGPTILAHVKSYCSLSSALWAIVVSDLLNTWHRTASDVTCFQGPASCPGLYSLQPGRRSEIQDSGLRTDLFHQHRWPWMDFRASAQEMKNGARKKAL